MLITPHFTLAEFDRLPRPTKGFPTRAAYPEEWIETRLRPLCEVLEVVREALGGKAIKIGSGYRDPAYNKAIGGAAQSQHTQGRAADITVAGVAPSVVVKTVMRLHREGRVPRLGGLGVYPTFTHLDVRPTRTLVKWTGKRTEN